MSALAATVLINGTVGVGKTATASALAVLLRESGVPHAVIDTDEIRRSWPAPHGDRFNTQLQLANLTSLSMNYRSAGSRVLIVSGVVEAADMVQRYRAAAGGHRMIMVRLTAAYPIREARITSRHAGDSAGALWHLQRTVELDRILDDAGLEDFTVDTFDKDLDSIAREIWERAAWLFQENRA